MTAIRKSLGFLSLAVMLGAGLAASSAYAADAPRAFSKCKACHTYKEGDKHRVGPNLWGVYDRTAGTMKDFHYSKAMKEKGAEGLVWDEASLDTFLTKPRKFVKGTKMGFPGFKKESDRKEVIEFLKTLK